MNWTEKRYLKDVPEKDMVTCKYCNYPYLRWFEKENGKWQLMKPNGGLHLCKPYTRREQ